MNGKHSRAGEMRARGRRKPPFIPVLIMAAGGFLASGGKNETGGEGALPANEWTITAPSSALPGDCIVVTLDAGSELKEAAVTLRKNPGEIAARAVPFPADPPDAGGTGARLVALIPLSSLLEPGEYSVEATALKDGRALALSTPVTVEKRNFITEEIALDASNTAIRTDTSPLRLAQTKALNDLLLAHNPEAARFAGPYRAPLASERRTSRFGDRRIYAYHGGKKETAVHWGIDFGVPAGTPVFAAGDGRVVLAEKRISTGWTVVIEHLPGVYSLYYHLDALLTSGGENVRAGTLIARSGNSGLSTGAHLHWEFRVNGEPVSPDWFAGRTLY